MAAAASIPNLATNIIGSVITHDDIGIGAVVGSSFFNVLFIPGAFGLAVSKKIELTPWPVIRDTSAYIISAIVLAVIIWDREVYWYESLVLLLMYVLYIVFLIFSDRVQAFCEKICRCCGCCKPKDTEKVGLVSDANKKYGLSGDGQNNWVTIGVKNPSIEDIRSSVEEEEAKMDLENSQQLSHNMHDQSCQTEKMKSNASTSSEESFDDSSYHSIMTFPKGKFKRLAWIVMLPSTLVIFFLIPDFQRPGCWRNVHYLTLIMSVLFIGGISYVLVWMISLIGETFGIPSSIMGMTLLAAGGSLPDCLNSVFAAKKGYGDMAFSNAIGSNMFDILFCLSVPWLIDYLFIEKNEPVPLYANMTLVSVFLLSSGVLVLVTLVATNFKINKKMATFFIVVYICFIIFDCAIELKTALPPCQ